MTSELQELRSLYQNQMVYHHQSSTTGTIYCSQNTFKITSNSMTNFLHASCSGIQKHRKYKFQKWNKDLNDKQFRTQQCHHTSVRTTWYNHGLVACTVQNLFKFGTIHKNRGTLTFPQFTNHKFTIIQQQAWWTNKWQTHEGTYL